ncbi:MAG TPA: hypothetical protein VKB88_10825 [Bryobacteraceae bacterium]|nr:hypothetical protein [Bryobacteraceae bacterium]
MELRYVGFDQSQNARAYRFEVIIAGRDRHLVTVTVDVGLFQTHRVGMQEGPNLCAKKLAADLEGRCEGAHELTAEDLRSFAAERDAEGVRRTEARQHGSRRSKTPPGAHQSPWRTLQH